MSRHVHRELPEYLDGLVAPARAREIAAHLDECARCRALRDRQLAGRAALRVLELPHSTPSYEDLRALRLTAPRRGRALLAGASIAAATLVAAVLIGRGGSDAIPGWAVTPVAGAPRIGRAPIAAEARLREGELLETGQGDRAELAIGRVGTLEVAPGTRLRLVRAARQGEAPAEGSHRVELLHGSVDARVFAPPRLFFVDTPAATAVDLGCAYRLTVDASGAGVLSVKSGRVALVRGELESVVRAGASCAISPGEGPGIPVQDDAAAPLHAALRSVEGTLPDPRTADLDAVLGAARRRDASTLWHLVPRLAPEPRTRTARRLAELVPPEGRATLEGLASLDPTALLAWQRLAESAR